MMKKANRTNATHKLEKLSRRHREIMDIAYQLRSASCAEIRAQMKEAPSYSAVRAMLMTLAERGLLTFEQHGKKYVFSPTVPRDQAKKGAIRRLLATFFEGSVSDAVVALLSANEAEVSASEIRRIKSLLDSKRASSREQGGKARDDS